MRTGLAVTITECRPVVESASSAVKFACFRDVAPLKKSEERILKRISKAKRRKTAEVVYLKLIGGKSYLAGTRTSYTQYVARGRNESSLLGCQVQVEVWYSVEEV